MSDLLNAFNDHFELVFATTPELMDQVFRLRYQVLCCQEQLPGFEPWRYPDGRETDAYDRHSVHCVLMNKRTSSVAGGVRLVLANPDDVTRHFPSEVAAAQYFDPSKINPWKLPRRQTAEISRLIIPKAHPASNGTQPHRTPAFPFPVLGLLAGVIRLSAQEDVTHVYALMEPLLNRLLRRFSLHFDPVAPVIDYHGMRQAHLSILADVMFRTFHERKEVWDLLTDGGRFLPPGHPPVTLADDQLPLCQIS